MSTDNAKFGFIEDLKSGIIETERTNYRVLVERLFHKKFKVVNLLLIFMLVSGFFVILNAVLAAAPIEPANVEAYYISDEAIRVFWADSSVDEDGFYLYREDDDGAFALIDTLASDSSTYLDDTPEADHKYRYRVVAYNIDGESSPVTSNSVYTTPAAPSGLEVDENVLTWDDPAMYSASFYIERQENNPSLSDDWEVIASDVSPYTDTSAVEGTDYMYRVRAKISERYSAYSEIVAGNWTFTEVQSAGFQPDNTVDAKHEMEVDGDGGLHAVMCDRNDFSLHYGYSEGDGEPWSFGKIADSGHSSCEYDFDLELDSTDNDRPHLIYNDAFGNDFEAGDVAHATYSATTGDWEFTDLLTTESNGNSIEVELEIDSIGILHILSVANSGGEGCNIIDISYWNYGIEEAEVVVENELVCNMYTGSAINISLALDSSDKPRYSYHYKDDSGDPTDEYVMYRECSADCVIDPSDWADSELVVEDTSFQSAKLLYDTFNDCEHILHKKDGQINHANNCAASWSLSENVFVGTMSNDSPWDAEINGTNGDIYVVSDKGGVVGTFYNLYSTGSWGTAESLESGNQNATYYDIQYLDSEPVVMAVDVAGAYAYYTDQSSAWTDKNEIYSGEVLGDYAAMDFDHNGELSLVYTTKSYSDPNWVKTINFAHKLTSWSTETVDTLTAPVAEGEVQLDMTLAGSSGNCSSSQFVAMSFDGMALCSVDQYLYSGSWTKTNLDWWSCGGIESSADNLDVDVDSSCYPVVAYGTGDSDMNVAYYDASWNIDTVVTLSSGVPQGVSVAVDSRDFYQLGYIDTSAMQGSQMNHYEKTGSWSNMSGVPESMNNHYALDVEVDSNDYPFVYHDNDDDENSSIGMAFYASAMWNKQTGIIGGSSGIYNSDDDRISADMVSDTSYVLHRNLYDTLSLSLVGGSYGGWSTSFVGEISASGLQDLVIDKDNGNRHIIAEVDGALVYGYSVAPPTSPGTLGSSSVTTSTISLGWTDNSNNEVRFELSRSFDAETWTPVSVSIAPDETSYTDTGLSTGTTYYYRIRACSDELCSQWETSGSMSTSVIAPSIPTLSTPSSGAIEVSLTPTFTFLTTIEEGVLRYKIEVAYDSSFQRTVYSFDQREDTTGWSDTAYTTGETASFTVPNNYSFSSNQTYYWRVRAYGEGNAMAVSSVRSFTSVLSSEVEESDIDHEETFYSMGNLNWYTSFLARNGSISLPAESSQLSGGTLTIDSMQTKKIELVDVDGDADLDVFEYNENYAQMNGISYLYINDGSGNFTKDSHQFGNIYDDMILGDVDNDGDIDVVKVGTFNYWELNDGTGNFTLDDESELISSNVRTCALGDLDRDGDLDLACAAFGENSNYVYTYAGGEYDGTSFGPADDTDAIAIADMNGDGYGDILVGNSNSQSKMCLNEGDGSYDCSNAFSSSGTYEVANFVVADMDNDGDLDVIEAGTGSSYVFYNDGTGNFDNTSLDSMPFGTMAEVGDVNGDGYLDVITNNSAHINNGYGLFEAMDLFSAEAEDVAVGDIDGDGLLEIIAAIEGGPNQVIHMTDATAFVSEEMSYMIMAMVDIEFDGDIDLLTVDESECGDEVEICPISLQVNDGEQGYTEIEITDLGIPDEPVVFDADADGDLDMLFTRGSDDEDSLPDLLLVNEGNYVFSEETEVLGSDGHSETPDAVDVDLDGDLDIVVVYEDSQSDCYAEVWLNNGGSFVEDSGALGSEKLMWCEEPVIGDIDLDGYPDILFLGEDEENVLVYMNDGNGDFDGEVLLDTYSQPNLQDLNNDGYPELTLGSDDNFIIYPNVSGEISSSNYKTLSIDCNLAMNSSFVDLDSDGDIDVLLPCGHMEGNQAVKALINYGNFNFVLVDEWFDDEFAYPNVVVGDYDSDGDIDFALGAEDADDEDTMYFYLYTQVQNHETDVDFEGISVEGFDATDDTIYSVTIEAEDQTPTGTSIDYYVAATTNAVGGTVFYEEVDFGATSPVINGVLSYVLDIGAYTIVYGDDLFFVSVDGGDWVDGDMEGFNVNYMDFLPVDESNSLLFMVGDEGGMYVFETEEGGPSQLCEGLTTEDLYDVHSRGDASEAVVVGDNGTAIVLDLDAEDAASVVCTLLDTGISEDLRVGAIPEGGSVVVGGMNGVFMASDDVGVTWEDYTGFTTEDILTDYMPDEGDYMLAGSNGTLIIFGDGDPEVVDTGMTGNITSLRYFEDFNEIYAVGDDGFVFYSEDGEGDSWEQNDFGLTFDLRGYASLSDDDLSGYGGYTVSSTALYGLLDLEGEGTVEPEEPTYTDILRATEIDIGASSPRFNGVLPYYDSETFLTAAYVYGDDGLFYGKVGDDGEWQTFSYTSEDILKAEVLNVNDHDLLVTLGTNGSSHVVSESIVQICPDMTTEDLYDTSKDDDWPYAFTVGSNGLVAKINTEAEPVPTCEIIDIGSTKNLYAVEVVDTNEIMILGEAGAVYFSGDGGSTWTVDGEIFTGYSDYDFLDSLWLSDGFVNFEYC
jgi:photosystem II stability/assembly factor-like uncharacterized protein